MDIERQVKETIEEYSLMEKKDKVIVALSGGKDSTSVVYILKKLGYDVHGLLIDLYLGEWSKIHNEKMTAFCEEYDIPLTIVDLKKEIGQGICFVKNVLKEKKGLTGCTVCGIVKRWVLNKWARKLEGDVIVTGHNLDDECQNVLMNFLKGNVELGFRMGPETGKQDRKIARSQGGFVRRVKPFFFVPEAEILKYAKEKDFDILYDRCPCAFGTYRVDTREWMEKNMEDEEKLKVVVNFMDVMKDKVGEFECSEARVCEKCGEVCRGRVCKFCEIVGSI
jgi:uncharacterized protein (TIGR00269 family)